MSGYANQEPDEQGFMLSNTHPLTGKPLEEWTPQDTERAYEVFALAQEGLPLPASFMGRIARLAVEDGNPSHQAGYFLREIVGTQAGSSGLFTSYSDAFKTNPTERETVTGIVDGKEVSITRTRATDEFYCATNALYHQVRPDLDVWA